MKRAEVVLAGFAASLGGIALYETLVRRKRQQASDGEAASSAADRARWTFDERIRILPMGSVLRVEVSSPAIVHWTANQWDAVHDTRTVRRGGVHVADLQTEELPSGARLQFTFYWPEVNRWEGEDFEVRVEQYATRHAG